MSFSYTPQWVEDLVIYEIATRNFTSPNGPESGTFRSLEAKLPYLSELGVNGIWLTGHNLADRSHFYNIWTQYAVIRPDVIDPVLGSEADFRSLIDAAHDRRIRVFLDVITHGVMNDSPLVTEHPEWFRPGTWGMTDYDWFGGHADLDAWWVATWAGYVKRYGIDGFRLDVNMYRPDLWWRIKRECRDAGHRIVVFHESGPGRRGVVDFLQIGIRHKTNTERLNVTDQRVMRLPDSLLRVSGNDVHVGYTVNVELENGERWSNAAAAERRLELADVTQVHAPDPTPNDPLPYSADEVVMRLSGLPRSCEIRNITVDPVATMSAGAVPGGTWSALETPDTDYQVFWAWEDTDVVVRFPQHLPVGTVLSLQLSCHDDGWDGFPAGENPYVAAGSRFAFGYGTLFAPAVPIFMSGGEFAADFVPNPRLTPGLFGTGRPGSGTWLYGSWIDWEQLREPYHAEMLSDVKRMIAIRREYRDLMRPLEVGGGTGAFVVFDHFAPRTMPTPYGYCNQSTLLIVIGNPYRRGSRSVDLTVPWDRLPLEPRAVYELIDLWNRNAPVRRFRRGESLALSVEADRTTGGGVGVWKLTPVGDS